MIGIYGANGFIGRNVVARMATAGHSLRAVSRRFDETFIGTPRTNVDVLTADFMDPLAMAASLQDVDTVVQLVSTSSPGLKNEHAIADIEDNVIPHVGFLKSCINAGVRRYVFVSSGGTVYGPGAATPTPEEAPVNPICSHGLTKLMIEKYIQMHGRVDGLEYAILRLANPFGPGQEYRKGQGLIPAILDRKRRGLPVKVFGGGQAQRDYVFIDDVADAVMAAATRPDVRQAVINIGSGRPRSVLEVLETIESVAGVSLEREWVEVRKTDVDVSCLDISRAKVQLGWHPGTAFREGVERTVNADAEL